MLGTALRVRAQDRAEGLLPRGAYLPVGGARPSPANQRTPGSDRAGGDRAQSREEGLDLTLGHRGIIR